MAKLKKEVPEVITETTEEVVTKKPTRKKTAKKDTRKTNQELTVELNKIETEVFVEILNVSTGRVLYMNKFGDAYVDLEPGENVALNLKQVKEICTKAKGFFSGGSLIITSLYNEEYKLSDILRFLKLDRVQMENYDYLEELIVEEDDGRFESLLRSKDKGFIKEVASKAVYLDSADDHDFELSRSKERILCDLLDIDTLIY